MTLRPIEDYNDDELAAVLEELVALPTPRSRNTQGVIRNVRREIEFRQTAERCPLDECRACVRGTWQGAKVFNCPKARALPEGYFVDRALVGCEMP